jgi:superfamily I DNA and/or RNA helicase
VIISTISQLSNPKIGPSLVKKERLHLIIDEATQICQAVIPHILSNYADALLKVTFVGDEKQLSPFGSDQFSSIKSPFDVLSCSETFLNVTYRLPFELTSFISKHVYAKKLLPFKVSSTHPIAFVDIPGTENEPKPGKIMVCFISIKKEC